jgi:hypothetical protein
MLGMYSDFAGLDADTIEQAGPPAPPGSITTPAGVTIVPSAQTFFQKNKTLVIVGAVALAAMFLLKKK